MRTGILPTRGAIAVVAALAAIGAIALAAGAPVGDVSLGAAVALALGLAFAALDLRASRRAWHASPLRWQRRLPPALAVGVRRVLEGELVNDGTRRWRAELFDHADPGFDITGLPVAVDVAGGSVATLRYEVVPRRRGEARFDGAELRLRSIAGSLDLRLSVGEPATLRVYPNFVAVTRYAWLAGDRRLSEIGIKSYPMRGQGTDFKQLADYQPGDAVRHIDWKATLKHRRPIVRQFQDERDQCVMFMLDCGRRMRADESVHAGTDMAADARVQPGRGTHFDEALNALMLLSYVALKEGDAVGAMTFGTEPGAERRFAPRNGAAALNALMGTLYDIEPRATHSDYLQAAADLMRVQRKRALVVVLTNFRDEDAAELQPALALLRTRHLVLLASLRERVLRELAEQPDSRGAKAVEVAGAHLFAQARSDAFRRLAGRDGLLVDVEPARLASELVNRYRAVKRAGLL